MNDKIFVGNALEKVNKFGETETVLGFKADDLAKLQSALNDKGWVNVYLKKSREGKPYMQLLPAVKPAATEPDLPF